MSWGFSCVGKPSKVAEFIQQYGDKLTGHSKLEFDDARPHLIALVRENFAAPDTHWLEPIIDFEASGSGTAVGPPGAAKQMRRSCMVSIKPLYKQLV